MAISSPVRKVPIDVNQNELASSPIKIFMEGFQDESESIRLAALFANASRWQWPWQLVTEIHQAQFLLVVAEEAAELQPWQGHPQFTSEHLIAYSKKPLAEARWHLYRPGPGQGPSPLEFTILLKEIGRRQLLSATVGEGSAAAPPPIARTSASTYRDKLKIVIVGSVGSGKTTAISTLSEGKAISTEAAPSDHTQLQKKSTTVAMDYANIVLDDNQLHIYGAPGQRRFDFMNQILINKAVGLIILVSNAGSDALKEMHYYLDANSEFLKDKQAVVGVTHNDINPSPSLNEYRLSLKGQGHSWPVLKVDARKREDLLNLVSTLVENTMNA